MTYQEVLQNLGETTERALVSHLQQYLDGSITLDMLTDLSVVVISTAQQQGRIAAELSFLAWLQSAGFAAEPVAAAQVAHYADTGRLRKAVGTVVGTGVLDPEVTAQRLGRLAYSEAVESSQAAFAEAMRESGKVEGWTRGLEPGACELCRWWSREGRVWPVDHTMPTHKGCTCTPVPAVEYGDISVSSEAARASSVRAAQGSYMERQQSGYADSKRESRKR